MRLGNPERRQTLGDIAQNFDENAAESEHHDRAERRVALDPENGLTPPAIIGATTTPSILASGRAVFARVIRVA